MPRAKHPNLRHPGQNNQICTPGCPLLWSYVDSLGPLWRPLATAAYLIPLPPPLYWEYSICFYPCCLQGFDPSSLLKSHVQGVLNHSWKTFYTYVDLSEYCHDSCLIMNVLLRTVHDSTGNVYLWLTIVINIISTIKKNWFSYALNINMPGILIFRYWEYMCRLLVGDVNCWFR